MNHPVVSALLPVFLLTALGYFAGRRGWLVGEGLKQLSTLVFIVLTPPLLFRTMAAVHLDRLDFRPLAAYFIGGGLIFIATLLALGFNRRGAVLGLANTYTNTVMIGIPLVGLAYGEAGLVLLFTLISVHALVMLTSATVVLELAMAREDVAAGRQGERHIAHTVLLAVRNTIIHPVPLPIILGLLFSWSGWVMPEAVDLPLKLLSGAFGPLALLLVGATLAATPIGENWRGALALSVVKNLVHPAVVAVAGWAIGLSGAPLAVMVLAAALPIGANVFLFSQRYQVAQQLVTASVAMSTMLGLVTLTVVMALLAMLPA